jgi:hypothetical protein
MTLARALGRSYAASGLDGDPDPLEVAGPDEPRPGPPSLGPMSVAGLTRRHLAFSVGALVVVWIVLVFARAVSDSAAIDDEAAGVRADNANLAARLAASERELDLVQRPSFVALEARGYGLGAPGERVFSIAGSATPAPLRVLGADAAGSRRQTPLDAWLDLLFGS